jgi:hypothetical protein
MDAVDMVLLGLHVYFLSLSFAFHRHWIYLHSFRTNGVSLRFPQLTPPHPTPRFTMKPRGLDLRNSCAGQIRNIPLRWVINEFLVHRELPISLYVKYNLPFFACILYPSSICGFWFDDFIRKQALQTINQIGMKSLEIIHFTYFNRILKTFL